MHNKSGNVTQKSFGKELIPTSLYEFDDRSVASVVKGARRFISACLHDPFVWSYSVDIQTDYKGYLQRELLRRQVDYVENLKKKKDDYQAATNFLDKLPGEGLRRKELNKLKKLLKLAYDNCDLQSVPSELLREVLKTADLNNSKRICEAGSTALEYLCEECSQVEEAYIRDCFNKGLADIIREKKKITEEDIEAIKKEKKEELDSLLTHKSRQAFMENILKENFLFEFVFEGWLFVWEILWGEFGICLFHSDPNQVTAFWRLTPTIAFVFLTTSIWRGLLNALWEISVAKGTERALKTWFALYEKVRTNVKDSWNSAANNLNDVHPFASAILDTSIIVFPWAVLCYYDMGYAHYMYACMDIMFLIRSKVLAGTLPDIKEIGEYLAIGWLRGYFKHCLMPKDPCLTRVIAHENMLTVISVVLGKLMHILYPFGNIAKPEGLK